MNQHIKVPYALLDAHISVQSKNVYLALMRYRSGRAKHIKVKMMTLAQTANLKVRQTASHIAALCQTHVLSRKQINYEGHYGCNTYQILCNEHTFVQLPYEVAFHDQLTAYDKMAYCVMKRFMDLKKATYTTYLSKQELSDKLNCSLNQVDKIKRRLQEAGFIHYKHNSKEIVFIYERELKDR